MDWVATFPWTGWQTSVEYAGYNVKALSELLGIRQPEVRAFLRGQLPPGRTAELHHQLLAAGLPLGERLGAVENRSATG